MECFIKIDCSLMYLLHQLRHLFVAQETLGLNKLNPKIFRIITKERIRSNQGLALRVQSHKPNYMAVIDLSTAYRRMMTSMRCRLAARYSRQPTSRKRIPALIFSHQRRIFCQKATGLTGKNCIRQSRDVPEKEKLTLIQPCMRKEWDRRGNKVKKCSLQLRLRMCSHQVEQPHQHKMENKSKENPNNLEIEHQLTIYKMN